MPIFNPETGIGRLILLLIVRPGRLTVFFTLRNRILKAGLNELVRLNNSGLSLSVAKNQGHKRLTHSGDKPHLLDCGLLALFNGFSMPAFISKLKS